MMHEQTRQTSRCHLFGHPEFILRADRRALTSDLDRLVAWLDETVESGTRYQDGQTIQVGWMIDRIKRRPDGMLTLQEPDMRVMPISWETSVARTLQQLRWQKDVADSCSLPDDLDFASCRSAVTVADDFAEATTLLLKRDMPQGSHSGWWFGGGDCAKGSSMSDAPSTISLYEAACTRPEIVMFMALPPETRVKWSMDRVIIWRHGQRLIPAKGSFLDALGDYLPK